MDDLLLFFLVYVSGVVEDNVDFVGQLIVVVRFVEDGKFVIGIMLFY